jgi:hypothetical protein
MEAVEDMQGRGAFLDEKPPERDELETPLAALVVTGAG